MLRLSGLRIARQNTSAALFATHAPPKPVQLTVTRSLVSSSRSLKERTAVSGTGSVSGQPGSKTFRELGQNAQDEAAGVMNTVADTISAANADTSSHKGLGGVDAITGDLNSVAGLGSVVPKEALQAGAAGLIPYFGTSLATIYLGRSASMMTDAGGPNAAVDVATAMELLHYAQYVQIQYGAIILSFLGAIHWGFEFSKFGGVQGSLRYLYGIAPVLAGGATLLIPSQQVALICQWFAFTAMWMADQRATSWGWTPKWYSTYRYWLTALAGGSILLSLAGGAYFSPESETAGGSARKFLEKDREERSSGPKGKEFRTKDMKIERTDDGRVLFMSLEKEKELKEKEEKESKEKEEEEKKAEADRKEKAREEIAIQKRKEAKGEA